MRNISGWTSVAAFGGLALLSIPSESAAQSSSKSEILSRVAVAPGSIHGIVHDDNGVPVAGVVVSAVAARVAAAGAGVASDGGSPAARTLVSTRLLAISDERGRFDLQLSPGAYVLTAHSHGFTTPAAQTITVRPSSRTASSFALRRAAVTARGAGTDVPILEAGVGLPGPSGRGDEVKPTDETAPPPVVEASSGDDHSELAWRLRHMRRGVLQGVTEQTFVGGDSGPGDIEPVQTLARAGAGRVAASLLAGASLSGELNFFTTSSFDTPQQLFNGEMFARNVAYMSVGAPAGSHADWAVRGALSQADLSSWMIAGTYATRGPARHQYDTGLSYATQRYDGGNPAALRDVTDGSRNAGAMYGFDTWTLSPALSVNYGARYARYDYLENQGLLSPRAGVTYSLGDRLRASASASRRSVAPGAEEFLPPGETGIWLPPQRTFSALANSGQLTAERATTLDVGLERDLGAASAISVHTFRQDVGDQLITLFGLDLPGPPSSLGHYFVGTEGDVEARGLTAGFHTATRRVQGSVEYSVARARWSGGDDLTYWVLLPSDGALRTNRIHDVSTTIRTDVPETSTRVVVFYRISNGFAPRSAKDDGLDSRFDVQIRQSLPFLDFSTAKWEVLVGIRNFFHDTVAGQSMFDELLVVRPPTRIVGGLTMRF